MIYLYSLSFALYTVTKWATSRLWFIYIHCLLLCTKWQSESFYRVWVSHSSSLNESFIVLEWVICRYVKWVICCQVKWVTYRVWISRLSSLSESFIVLEWVICRYVKWVIYRVWISHLSCLNESFIVLEWMSHLSSSKVSHLNRVWVVYCRFALFIPA